MNIQEPLSATSNPEGSVLQCDANGHLRHLLTLRDIDKQMLTSLLDKAQAYRSPLGTPVIRNKKLAGRTVANLFFEASTRTRASFEIAATRLGADVLNLDVNMSSRIKGESILDTIYTLQAMQVDLFVVRDANAGVPASIAQAVKDYVSVVNAGESDVSHPTQGLLDLLTMRQIYPDFTNLTVAIVGDVAHSRVARSTAEGLQTLGVGELRLVCPTEFAPAPSLFPNARILSSLEDGLRGANVVMALRIQRERINNLDGIPSVDDYYANFGVTRDRMRGAAPDAIVMHPGPMNRGVEIESQLADSSSSVIEMQVTNGVAVRMAVLDTITATMDMK